MMNRGGSLEEGEPTKQQDEQGRNPRHLQWEMRFSQLQRFKAKYGHAQVPIGWPENVQLANWVSKQRQEYKNLLRGRATRLDENRIRLLNSVNFAWQLQRGGRRRQLKAKEQRKKGKEGEKGSDSDADEEPCILPGEVVIGQGSPTSLGLPQLKMGNADAQRQRIQPSTKEASPLQQPLQPSLQPLQQSMQHVPSVPSTVGMQYLNRTAGPLAVPNNDLLDYVLARNSLLQNLQTSSLPVSRGYPQMGLQTSTSTQRNALLPVLPQQSSSLFPLTASAFTNGPTGGTSTSTPWSTSITSSLLETAPAGARMGRPEDESKLSDGVSNNNYKTDFQQQQQQTHCQGNQSFAFSNPTLYGGLDNQDTSNLDGQHTSL